MISASFSASALTVAPTAVKSESSKPDLIPAPGSIATSAPSALNFFTVSGETATRGSAGSISLATAIFMGPPDGARRAHYGRGTGCDATQPNDRSDQEVRHQGQDHANGDRAVLHQGDEALIGRLMGRIVHAVGGRVGHFAMICHCCPQSKVDFWARITANEGTGQRRAAYCPIGKANFPGSGGRGRFPLP